MFQPKKKTKLEAEIDRLTLALKDHDPDSEKYGSIVERLSKLHKLKCEDAPKRISPDVALTVGANILGLAMIINHEQLYPLTSKALPFILKAKI